MLKCKKILMTLCFIVSYHQAHALTAESIIAKINDRFEALSKDFFQKEGFEKTFQLINGRNDNNYEFNPIEAYTNGSLESGGNVICIEESKVVAASSDPTLLQKDVSKDSFTKDAICKLRSNPDEKVILTQTTGKNTQTTVVWGRKALMGDKLNKDIHTKFFCYISFKTPQS